CHRAAQSPSCALPSCSSQPVAFYVPAMLVRLPADLRPHKYCNSPLAWPSGKKGPCHKLQSKTDMRRTTWHCKIYHRRLHSSFRSLILPQLVKTEGRCSCLFPPFVLAQKARKKPRII